MWILHFKCPRCEGECPIHQISANAAGEIRFYGKCETCSRQGHSFCFTSSTGIIKRYCREADQEDANEPKTETKLLPKPPEGLSDEDLKWLHDMKIEDEDKEGGNK